MKKQCSIDEVFMSAARSLASAFGSSAFLTVNLQPLWEKLEM